MTEMGTLVKEESLGLRVFHLTIGVEDKPVLSF